MRNKSFAYSAGTGLLVGVLSLLTSFAISAQVPRPAAAKAEADSVEIKLTRQKVVSVDGKETLGPAATARPGEVLLETATHRNRSAAPVTQLEATLPIPVNTEFIPGSASPISARASIDGRVFEAMPLKRKVTGKNGVVTEQVVPVAQYRFLRWTIGTLAAGQSAVVSARVKVADDAPTKPAS